MTPHTRDPQHAPHTRLRAAARAWCFGAILLTCFVVAGPGAGQDAGEDVASREQIEVPMNRSGLRRVVLERMPDGAYRYLVNHDNGEDHVYTPEAFADLLYKQQTDRPFWQVFLNISSPLGVLWVGVGLLGQVLFTGRMIVQWLASEKSKKSVVPVAFWWMSVTGASMLLLYFIWRRDVVGVLGQATGWFIYIRNLYFIYRPTGHAEPTVADDPGPEPELAE